MNWAAAIIGLSLIGCVLVIAAVACLIEAVDWLIDYIVRE